MGAAAVDIRDAACGRADAYIEAGIFLGTLRPRVRSRAQARAAADVLEKLSDVRFRYLCTNGKIHDTLRKLVVGALPKF